MPQRYVDFDMPDVGEGLTEAEILTWHVRVGDTVAVNQVLVEIETAKASVELPSPHAGMITQLHAQPGDTVDVGAPIVSFDLDPAGGPAEPVPVPVVVAGGAGAAAAPVEAGGSGLPDSSGVDVGVANLVGYGPRTGRATRRPRTLAPVEASVTAASGGVTERVGGLVALAKPPVRKLARELGVDLRTVTASGAGGVISREDVHRASGTRPDPAPAPDAAPDRAQPQPLAVPAEEPSADLAGYDPATRERRVPVRGVRRATAAAVVASAFTAPHVTEFLTVDVTPMWRLRERLAGTAEFRDVKLSPLAFAARAVCLAVRRTPDVNASWDEAAGEIVYKEYVHLGIAAATPRGLVVPKVRDADRLSLRELAAALGGLAETARAGRTAPADLVHGTITITNVGVFGVDTGTPIINPGESAILALGAIADRPWVVDGQLAVRKVCQLSLSFDHRVVDGQQGSRFLADVGALLADPALAITY
jgi:pyruvate dehydrogenase E2 component (dihydrolipoamide acetyltransferase)